MCDDKVFKSYGEGEEYPGPGELSDEQMLKIMRENMEHEEIVRQRKAGFLRARALLEGRDN